MNSARDVRVRSALPSDRAAMLAITREVWDGNDYFPEVWKDWVESEPATLMAAEIDGQLVGLQHVYVQRGGICWLEGIRVAPAMRRLGVARTLLEAGITWARTHCCVAVRLSTSTQNEATTRLAARAGFRQTARYVRLSAAPAPAPASLPPGSTHLASPAEREAVARFLTRLGDRPLVMRGWTAYSLEPADVARLLGTCSIAVAGAREIEALAIVMCPRPFTTLSVGLLTGSDDAAESLGRLVRAGAHRSGLEELRAMVQEDDPALQGAERAGFEPASDFRIVIHELPLVTTGSE